MDTKSKKRKLAVSMLLFFVSVSLLLANGVQLAAAMYEYRDTETGFFGMMNQDYQNTQEFRRAIQGKLSNFLAIASGGVPGGYYDTETGIYYEEGLSGWYGGYYEGEISYADDDASAEDILDSWEKEMQTQNDQSDSGQGDEQDNRKNVNKLSEEQRAAAAADAYHESLKRNKNLLYRICIGGKELYSNMEEISWETNSETLPDGYNFLLRFQGEKVSILKDGKELDVYGDGYYRGGNQWYVPGYQNFAADDGFKQAEVLMLAAKEPVQYSYVRYRKGAGGFEQADNRLYEIAQNVRTKHDRIKKHVFWFCAAAALFLVYLCFFRRYKKQADDKIGMILGKIWAEFKLLMIFALAAGIHETVTHDDFSVTFESQTDENEEALAGTDWLDELDMEYAEEDSAQADTGFMHELSMAQAEADAETAWTQRAANLQKRAAAAVTDPVTAPVIFWAVYLLAADIKRNRRRCLNGFLTKLVRKARLNDLKQPFSIQQTRRFVLAAAAGIVFAAASLIFILLLSEGRMSGAQAAFAQCLNLTLYLSVIWLCLSRAKQQAAELDLLAEHIRCVQDGDYTEKESFSKESALRPLSDSLSQIRQGMEKAVEEKLKSERMKVELVANVSHDLKTPLTSIISYIAFLKQEEDLPEHVKDFIRILDEKAGRLNSIVQDVFSISKAAVGQLPVELKELDFGKLLLQTLADMQEQIQAAPVTVKTEIPKEPLMITADGARMYRVFQNLILNALQYSLEGSRVFVDLRKEGSYAIASVKNTSKDELLAGTDFTERFVRGDASRTDGGAGLGLSIAKSFTQACGGEFALEAEADLFVVRVRFFI